MTAVRLRGLPSLRARLAARDLPLVAQNALRREADAVAEEAARAAPGALGGTVTVVDKSRGGTFAYAVGTAHRAGRFTEHGTARQLASPWLWPAFRARLPRIKQSLRDTVMAYLARSGGDS